MTTTAVRWDHAVELYLCRCEGNGLTASSLDNYRQALLCGRLPAFRERHGIEGPGDLTAELLETLKAELRSAGLRPASVAHTLRAVKSFAHFAFDSGWLTAADVLLVRLPKQPKSAPDVFNDGDVHKLLAACVTERDRVLVELAVESGLRRAEIVRLEVNDIVSGPAGWVIRVRSGKGRKDRSVPISDGFAEKLGRYVSHVRPATSTPFLFVTTKRSPGGEYKALTGDGLYRIWNRIGRATGIRAYPHKGRHTFATRAAQDGVAPWAIQGALGHSSIDQTERYVRLAAVDLTAAFAKGRDDAGGTRVLAQMVDIRRRLDERSPTPYWAAEFIPAAAAKSYIRALTAVSLALSRHLRIDGAHLAELIALAVALQGRGNDAAASIDQASVAVLESLEYW